MDLAKLNIEINSKDALTANQRLGRLAVTGKGTEKQMVSLATSSRALNGRLAINAKQFERMGALAKRAGKALTIGLSVPLLAAGAKAAQVASQFEEEMTRINTLVGLSTETVGHFEDQVLALAETTGRGPRELARALFTVTSAGIRGAESLEILEQSAKASAIGLGDTQDIARSTTAVLQAYGKENISAARATEVLLSTVREGNLEAADLAPVLGRVLGIASQLGISFEEIGANIATFTRLGVGAEEAVVGLRGVMNSLLKPSSEAVDTLDQAGLSFDMLRKMVRERGLTETMRTLVQLFDGNDEALSRIIPNVRALANVLGTAGAQGESYSQILENIENNHGLVEDGFKTVGDTAAQQWDEAKVALEVAAISLRDSLLPAFKQVSKIVKDAAGFFSSLDAQGQKNVATYGLLAIVAGPVLLIFGNMVSILPNLISLMGMLNRTLALNPWTALAGVVGALATLFVGRYLMSTKEATEVTSDFQKAVQETGASVKEAAKELENLSLEQMLGNTRTTLRAVRKEASDLEKVLREQFSNVQAGGMFEGSTFNQWLDALEENQGRRGNTGRFQDLQDTIQALREQEMLIGRLRELERGRSNVLAAVGGDMERLSSYAQERIRKDEQQIDLIRTQLGLSNKYTQQEQDAAKAGEDVNEVIRKRVGLTQEMFNSIPDAVLSSDPRDIIDQAMLGLVTIAQAETALAQLQANLENTYGQEGRDELNDYIATLEKIIAEMRGVESSTDRQITKQKQLNNAVRQFDMVFSSALEDALVDFKNLQDIAQAFLQDLIRIIARMAIVAPIKKAVTGFLGDILPGAGDATAQNAKGGIFTGLTTTGGSSPQMFGEAGPEAVLPLTRNNKGQLAVHSEGGGNVQININNYSSQDVKTEEGRTANGGRKVDITVGSMMAKDIGQRGPLARSLESTYGLNRNTRRRN